MRPAAHLAPSRDRASQGAHVAAAAAASLLARRRCDRLADGSHAMRKAQGRARGARLQGAEVLLAQPALGLLRLRRQAPKPGAEARLRQRARARLLRRQRPHRVRELERVPAAARGWGPGECAPRASARPAAARGPRVRPLRQGMLVTTPTTRAPSRACLNTRLVPLAALPREPAAALADR